LESKVIVKIPIIFFHIVALFQKYETNNAESRKLITTKLYNPPISREG
jgi:hypothetical protein